VLMHTGGMWKGRCAGSMGDMGALQFSVEQIDYFGARVERLLPNNLEYMELVQVYINAGAARA